MHQNLEVGVILLLHSCKPRLLCIHEATPIFTVMAFSLQEVKLVLKPEQRGMLNTILHFPLVMVSRLPVYTCLQPSTFGNPGEEAPINFHRALNQVHEFTTCQSAVVPPCLVYSEFCIGNFLPLQALQIALVCLQGLPSQAYTHGYSHIYFIMTLPITLLRRRAYRTIRWVTSHLQLQE